MKKIASLLLIIMCAFLLVGCANGKNYYMQTVTSLSVSDFYSEYYTSQIKPFEMLNPLNSINLSESLNLNINDLNVQLGKIYDDSDFLLYQHVADQRCLISMFDFKTLLNQTPNPDDPLDVSNYSNYKMYEYNDVSINEYIAWDTYVSALSGIFLDPIDQFNNAVQNAESTNAYVLVQNTNQGQILNTYLFYKNGKATLNDLIDSIPKTSSNSGNNGSGTGSSGSGDNEKVAPLICVTSLSYNFNSAELDLQTNTYTNIKATIKVADVSLDYMVESIVYRPDLAMLDFSIDYGFVKIHQTIKKFERGISVFRIVLDYPEVNQNENIADISQEIGSYIYEQTSTDYFKQAKVGMVDNVANIPNILNITFDNFAKQNDSDKSGYILTYDYSKSRQLDFTNYFKTI